MIEEGAAREVFDSALAMLVAAARLDADSPSLAPTAGAGFAAEVTSTSVGYRLTFPRPSPILVVRRRGPANAE